jgi:hypothetical protein
VNSEAQKFKIVTHKVQSLAEENRKSFQEKCSCDVFSRSLSQKSCFPQLGKKILLSLHNFSSFAKLLQQDGFSLSSRKIAPIYSERERETGKARHEKHRASAQVVTPLRVLPYTSSYVPESK